MKRDTSVYRWLLDAKVRELLRALHSRGRIAMEYSAEEIEQAVLKGEREFAMLAIDRDTQLLREVRSAVARIADGSFGICEECDVEIPNRRLQAVPWARRCIICQEAADRRAEHSSFRVFPFAA